MAVWVPGIWGFSDLGFRIIARLAFQLLVAEVHVYLRVESSECSEISCTLPCWEPSSESIMATGYAKSLGSRFFPQTLGAAMSSARDEVARTLLQHSSMDPHAHESELLEAFHNAFFLTADGSRRGVRFAEGNVPLIAVGTWCGSWAASLCEIFEQLPVAALGNTRCCGVYQESQAG